MASKAYILIETKVGKANDVVRALHGIKGVTESYSILGPHDAIAVVEGADLRQVSDVVSRDIHRIPGVVRTTTCVVIN